VPDARGALFGLTRGTTRENLVRAALEAMAYGTQEVLEAMEADSSTKTIELRVDGGAAKNDWLLGFQSGLLGVPVRRPALVETTALGAAGLAGLATGLWSNAEDFLASQGEATHFTPRMADPERTTLLTGWAQAVQAVKWLAAHDPRD